MLGWEWYQSSDTKALFIHLLFKAAYQDSSWRGVEIKRGQILTGRKKLSTELGLSEKNIRTCLKRLKKTGEVAIKTANKYSIITLCNYELYQLGKGLEGPAERPLERPAGGPAKGQVGASETATFKEVKKVKNGKKEIKGEGKEFKLPEWINSDLWSEFMGIRIELKAVNSLRARNVLIKKLSAFNAQGYNPNDLIISAIENSWKSIYLPKRKSRSQPVNKQNLPGRIAKEINETLNWSKENRDEQKGFQRGDGNTQGILSSITY